MGVAQPREFQEVLLVDPVSMGSFAASVLSMAAEAALKAGVGEAVKDAYKALRDRLAPKAGDEIALLEKKPGSRHLQAAVAEVVDALPPADSTDVRALAEALLNHLQNAAPAIGLDIGRLKALEVDLGTITVTGPGTGVRIADAEVHGRFATGNITVGAPPGKI